MINIRKATQKDLKDIVSFNVKMAAETERKTLNRKILTKGISQVFENPNKGFYLVAEFNHTIIGQLLVTTEWSDWRNSNFWWIQSVYVLPKYRRKGVYRQLHNKVLTLAKQKGTVCGIRLYVDKSNLKAQKTYQTVGMVKSRYIMMEKEFKKFKSFDNS